MATEYILDYDPELGMMQTIRPDEDGVTLVTTSTNLKAALDQNKRLRNEHQGVNRGDQTWGHLVASIPTWVWEQFCRENPELRLWTEDAQVWLLKRLNDIEYRDLKVYDGGVGLVRQV